MEETTQSANFNKKWLDNIYENIKKLEDYERMAREGCVTLLDYFNIPAQRRDLLLADAQFKNLRFMVTELHLLLSDLVPILDKEKEKTFTKRITEIDKALRNKNLFTKEIHNLSRQLIQIKFTPLFYETINIISASKRELFNEIKNILYIEKPKENW